MTLHDPASPVFVSMTESATATACTRINVADVLTRIRSGVYQARVQQVRSALATSGKDAANEIKRTLPGVLFSGEFTARRKSGLVQHSGLIGADFDQVPNPVALRGQLATDAHCVAAFLSPSGEGVKALFVVDATRPHAESWRAVKAHCQSVHGVEIDRACKDVSRLCFVSFDPNMYIAAGEVACVDYPPAAQPVVTATADANGAFLTPGEDFNQRGDVPTLLREHGWHSSDETYWTRPGKDSGPSASLGVVEGPPNSFWVFSSNAQPFVPNKRYEPWQVFALLECGGDYALACSELQKRGYGPAGADRFLILPSACGLSISEAAAKIFGAIAPTFTLFNRGRVAHEVVSDEHGARLESVTPRAFRSRLDKHGKLMAWRADRDGRRKLSPAICAEETASALLATTEAREFLPKIRAIVTSPTLALQGSDEVVTLGHGWNPHNGGVFVTGRHLPESVPLPEAVTSLSALLDDFQFQSGGDRSRALASLVTPAMKAGGLLNVSTPIEVCEADKSQSGKGFLRKLAATLYAETPSFVTQKEGGVGSLDEALASALIAGRPFIQFDNMRGKVSSTYLEAILTADGPVPCREPHKTTVEVDVRPFTFSMTSNGVEATRDLANRCSIVRIKKQPPGYVFRMYHEGGLLDHVRARQPYYLGCVFSVVGEWFMAGSPRTTESRHDFRVWAQTMDWIVTNLFSSAPLMEGHNAARDRVSDQGRTWLRAIALALADDGRLDHDLAASVLAEVSAEHDIPVPLCRADVDDMDRARAIGKVMAKAFREGEALNVDNFVITRSRIYSPAAAKEIPHYRFSVS